MVKVSIIMPVYNSQQYLEHTLKSILNQSFKDFELICVDDGSTDDSLKILKSHARRNSCIKIITQENGGSGAARNCGLKACTGEYVYFVDSDDYIFPDLIRLTYANITDNDSDIVLFKIANIEGDRMTFITPDIPYERVFPDADFNSFTFNHKDITEYILRLYYAPWTKLYKKEFLDRFDDFLFDENLPYEDILFHLKSMLRASKISYVPKYLYYYRIDNRESVTFHNEDHIKIFDVVDNIESFLRDENYLKDLKTEFEYFKLSQILLHMALPVDEKYYEKAKANLEDADFTTFTNPREWVERRWMIFKDSTSYKEYEKNIKVPLMIEEYNRLKRANRKLKRERKRQRKLKKQLLSSTSWRTTRVFRDLFKKF